MRGSSRKAVSQKETSRAEVQEFAAGEQGHVVTLPHQLLGQVRDDALGASVKARRAAFVQGSNLRDFHGGSPALPGVENRKLSNPRGVPALGVENEI